MDPSRLWLKIDRIGICSQKKVGATILQAVIAQSCTAPHFFFNCLKLIGVEFVVRSQGWVGTTLSTALVATKKRLTRNYCLLASKYEHWVITE